MLLSFRGRLTVAALLFLLGGSALHAQPRAATFPGPVTTASDRASAGVVRLHLDKVYYDVDGATPGALAAALEARGPRMRGRRFFGMTEWEVRANYRGARRADACHVQDLTVRVSVETHLPRWRRRHSASPALQRAWSQFLDALDRHEQGHRVLAEQAAEAIRMRLAALEAPTCRRLEAAAYREVDLVIDEYEEHNETYDRGTDHGRRQGAVWPPR